MSCNLIASPELVCSTSRAAAIVAGKVGCASIAIAARVSFRTKTFRQSRSRVKFALIAESDIELRQVESTRLTATIFCGPNVEQRTRRGCLVAAWSGYRIGDACHASETSIRAITQLRVEHVAKVAAVALITHVRTFGAKGERG